MLYFFHKLRNISIIYKQESKQKVVVNRKMKLDTLAKLEVATANLHGDINNFEKQWEVNRFMGPSHLTLAKTSFKLKAVLAI